MDHQSIELIQKFIQSNLTTFAPHLDVDYVSQFVELVVTQVLEDIVTNREEFMSQQKIIQQELDAKKLEILAKDGILGHDSSAFLQELLSLCLREQRIALNQHFQSLEEEEKKRSNRLHLIHNELTTLNSELSDFEPVRSVNLNDFDFENLSLPRMQQLEKVVTLLMNEKRIRMTTLVDKVERIQSLWNDIGHKTDSAKQGTLEFEIANFMEASPGQLLLLNNIASLEQLHNSLHDNMLIRRDRIQKTLSEIHQLWCFMEIPEEEIAARHKQFEDLQGVDDGLIEMFEGMLRDLQIEKEQYMKQKLDEKRDIVRSLWDTLGYSEEEREKLVKLNLRPTDENYESYFRELLNEISRLQRERNIMDPLVKACDHLEQSRIQQVEFARVSSARLLDKTAKPGARLEEEKERKRLTKQVTHLEAQLKTQLHDVEVQYKNTDPSFYQKVSKIVNRALNPTKAVAPHSGVRHHIPNSITNTPSHAILNSTTTTTTTSTTTNPLTSQTTPIRPVLAAKKINTTTFLPPTPLSSSVPRTQSQQQQPKENNHVNSTTTSTPRFQALKFPPPHLNSSTKKDFQSPAVIARTVATTNGGRVPHRDIAPLLSDD